MKVDKAATCRCLFIFTIINFNNVVNCASRHLRKSETDEEKLHNFVETGGYCLKVWPSQGEWIDDYPFWIDFNCKKYAIREDDFYKKCLGERTIFVLGNSVTRGYVFELEHILVADNHTRLEGKSICQTDGTGMELSVCIRNAANTKLKYLMMWYMDGFSHEKRGGFHHAKHLPTVDRPPVHYNPYDFCDYKRYENITECLQYELFPGANENDILIFSLGSFFSFFGGYDPLVHTEAWLNESAIAFCNHLENSGFQGRVYRVVPARYTFGHFHKNKALERHNDILWELWGPNSVACPSAASWYTVDQYSINYGRERFFYEDHIHFQGTKLNTALMLQILNHLCP